MELSVDQYYRWNHLVLSMYGLWPYQSRTATTWIKQILIILYLASSASVQVITNMTELTADFIFDVLPIIIPAIAVIIQFLNRIIINDKLRDLFDQIKTDWECTRSRDEIEIMQTNTEGARITTKLFLLYMFVGVTVYILSIFIPQVLDIFVPLNESRSREHPFHVGNFFDQDKYFYTVRFIMYVMYVLGIFIANGTMFVMQHASGMFTILGHHAEQTFSDDEHLPKNRSICGKDYRSVALFVEDHRNVLHMNVCNFGHEYKMMKPLTIYLYSQRMNRFFQICGPYSIGLILFIGFLGIVALVALTMVQDKRFVGYKKEYLIQADNIGSIRLMEFKEFNKASSKQKTFKMSEMFIRQLLQFKGMSIDKVAIIERYASPQILTTALENSDQCYRWNRLVLSMYALWPYQNRTASTQIRRLFIILYLSWNAYVQVIMIFTTELTIDFLIDVLPIIIPAIGAIIQFVNRIIINDNLRDLFDQIKTDWECARSRDEIEIMQSNAKSATITTKFFLLYMFVGITLYMLSTLIPQILDVFVPLNESRSREHPFQLKTSFDQDKYFYTLRLIMYVNVMYILGILIVNGTVFVIYMQHASGMFTILGHRAEQTFSDDEQLPKNQSIREKDYRSVALFVEDHRNVLKFVDLIQSCYGFTIFSEYLCIIILMALTMVQTIRFTGPSDRPIRSAAYVTGQLSYIFMYSYMGQQLINKSSQLFMKIYYARWDSISIRKQKLMLFVMLKCKQTITFNAYNMHVLSLETFLTIVQSAISFCMMLRCL